MKSIAGVISGLILGTVTWGSAQPGLGGIQWTHDLSVTQISLQYPGSNASATGRYYTIEPNTEVTVLVTVKNLSSNPSMPYRLELTAGGQSIGTLPGTSVPSQGEKQFSFKWKPTQPGQGDVEARLGLNSDSNKQACASCRSARGSTGSQRNYSVREQDARCNFPTSCSVGSMGAPCGCHPTTDNPRNNSAKAAYQVAGDSPPPPVQPTSIDGVDLKIDSAYTKASVAKMGTYEAYITISNQGNRAHTGMIEAEVTVGTMTRTVTFTGGLKPGESKTEIVEFTKSGRCKVVLDPKNTIKEADETNNSR